MRDPLACVEKRCTHIFKNTSQSSVAPKTSLRTLPRQPLCRDAGVQSGRLAPFGPSCTYWRLWFPSSVCVPCQLPEMPVVVRVSVCFCWICPLVCASLKLVCAVKKWETVLFFVCLLETLRNKSNIINAALNVLSISVSMTSQSVSTLWDLKETLLKDHLCLSPSCIQIILRSAAPGHVHFKGTNWWFYICIFKSHVYHVAADPLLPFVQTPSLL